MSEIKMVYGEIEAQLRVMKQACDNLKPQAANPITGNRLDVAEKLTDIGIKLESLLVKYQSVLSENIKSTEGSVDFMRNTDHQLSGTMHNKVM